LVSFPVDAFRVLRRHNILRNQPGHPFIERIEAGVGFTVLLIAALSHLSLSHREVAPIVLWGDLL